VRTLLAFGDAGTFLAETVRASVLPPVRLRFVIDQVFDIGVKSLVIIVVTGLFTGMVLGLQGYNTLSKFGSEEALGTFVALSLIRELGPVLGGLLVAGRAGSAITAEIGLMKTTEQIAALEVMAVDPMGRVVAPRWLAGMIAVPLLVAIFDVVGIYGGYLVGVDMLGVNPGAYWVEMEKYVDFDEDVFGGMVKAFVFGLFLTWMATHQGWSCRPTSEGVGQATTRTVVISSVGILIIDYVLTAILM